MSHATLSGRLYLDHAATTPILPKAREAMLRALESWANPSSPHADGRAARAALEDARARIAAALGWHDHVIFTSGASEAIAIALTRAKARRIVTSTRSEEHTSELQSLMRISYAVFCLKKKKTKNQTHTNLKSYNNE